MPKVNHFYEARNLDARLIENPMLREKSQNPVAIK